MLIEKNIKMGLQNLIKETKDINRMAYKKQRYNMMQYHAYNKIINNYEGCYQMFEKEVYIPLMKIYEGE